MIPSAPLDSFQSDRIWKPSPLDAVLLAEDDPVFRHLLASWLRRWSYTVIAVDNGLAAWDALQQQDAPQMAILDWVMPGMDGVELCRRVRGRGIGLYRYLLLITAKDDRHDVVVGLEAGADDYLTKPFDMEELRARIRCGTRILQLQDALLRTQEALQFQAAHDPLTGLWNRRAILDLLQREVQLHQRTGGRFGVMMADLDHFKQINDSHGHLSGDEVLREVSRRLSACVRSYDYVGRYGGEEFLVIVSTGDLSDLRTSAERLRRCVGDTPIETTGGRIVCTISLGVTSTEVQGEAQASYEAVLRNADMLLYQAKDRGRNRVEIAALAQSASAGSESG
ncbi:MAG TPA: diguanylate cyclase [Terriglobales bacterium]|nr:diguanylate cyclase [Terriglobales bacterium]